MRARRRLPAKEPRACRLYADGARCCSCGQGKSLGSCLALTAGTILTALSCGGFSLGILVLGYYKDCDGRAWNSFA